MVYTWQQRGASLVGQHLGHAVVLGLHNNGTVGG